MKGCLNYGTAAGPLGWWTCSILVWPCLIVFATKTDRLWQCLPTCLLSSAAQWCWGFPGPDPPAHQEGTIEGQVMHAHSATNRKSFAVAHTAASLDAQLDFGGPLNTCRMPKGSTRSQIPRWTGSQKGAASTLCAKPACRAPHQMDEQGGHLMKQMLVG